MREPKEYSQKAQQVLALAAANARRLAHPYISSEHLLLAVVDFGRGIGSSILVNGGLVPERIRHHLAEVGPTEEDNSNGYGESAQCILAIAAKHAINLEHVEVEPEHLALALLNESHGIIPVISGATKALQHFGIDIEATRKLLLGRISQGASA